MVETILDGAVLEVPEQITVPAETPDAATITAGGETISLEIQPGAQGQYLDGSWDARAGLLENLGAAKTVAEKLPYVSNYA